MAAQLRFGLLGPLQVWMDRQAIAMGGPKNQAVMAALLLQANRVVAMHQLIASVWGDAPPDSANTQVRNRISTLRRLLQQGGAPTGVIRTQGTGYILLTDETQLDINDFEQRVNGSNLQAASGHLEAAVTGLADALTLWRGPALDGLRNGPLDAAAQRLDERRLAVLRQRIELELTLGRHEKVIAELTELVQTYPWHERFAALLMTAFYAANRRQESLECFERIRRLLADDLGVHPGPLLSELRDRVLRDDPNLRATTELPAGPPPVRLLPPDLADFVGRRAEIETLMRGCTPTSGSTTFVIHGLPGVGKTSLATRVAHLLRPAMHGTELYVDLRGHETPASPAEVLLRFLRVLGVDHRTIPDGLEERAALFRMAVAHQRCLLLLDNAASSSQVRPLLPGGRVIVLVTSRKALFDLDGAQHLKLRPLALDDAIELVKQVIGPARVAAERTAAEAIAGHCGMLPLGLRLSAARLAARPHVTLAQAAAQMADLTDRLDHLARPDRNVRTAFNSAYDALSEPARRMLRRLALLDLPDAPMWLCAAITTEPSISDDALAELVEANLVDILETDAVGQQRWRLHDLVKAFAREQATVEDAPNERSGTLHRAFAAWLHLAEQATVSLSGENDSSHFRFNPAIGHGDVNTELHLRDSKTWFAVERLALSSMIRQAASTPDAAIYACALTWSLDYFLCLDVRFGELIELAETALTAAANSDYSEGVAAMHLTLAFAYFSREELEPALEYVTAAAAAVGTTGNRWLLAETLGIEAQIRDDKGEVSQAARLLQRSARLFEEIGDLTSAGMKLARLGDLMTQQGQPTADAVLTRGIELLRKTNAVGALAKALRRLGRSRARRGAMASCRQAYLEALDLVRQYGDVIGEVCLLADLAVMLADGVDIVAATQYATDAIERSTGLNSPLYVAYARYARGRVALYSGMPARARGAIAEVIDNLKTNAEWHLAALSDLGRAHYSLGDLPAAHQHWEEALQIAKRINAVEEMDTITANLAACPARASKSSRPVDPSGSGVTCQRFV